MEVEHTIFMQAFSFCQASAYLIQFSVQLQPGSLHPTEKREQTILTTLQLKALGVLHCAPLDVPEFCQEQGSASWERDHLQVICQSVSHLTVL